MVLPFNDRYKRYDPVVPTTEFIVDFPVFDDDDLSVFVASEETIAFTVDSTYVFGVSNSTTITLNSAVSGVSVEIYGSRQPARGSNFLGNSPVFPGNIQRDMDAMTAVQQEMYRDHARILAEQEDLQEQINGLDGDIFYTTRAEIIDDLGTRLKNFPEGREVRIPGLAWVKMSPDHPNYGTDPIPDMPGYAPAGAWSLLHFGTVGDGVTFDDAAVQAAHAAAPPGGFLKAPAGVYRLTQPVPSDAINLYGEGDTSSVYRWDSGDGLEVTASGLFHTMIRGVGLQTKGVGTGVALSVDYSALISGAPIVPRAESHVKIRDVFIQGATGYTVDGWSGGIDLISILGADITGTRINGVYTGGYGSTPNSDFGIRASGLGFPVQLTARGNMISAVKDAILTDAFEGIYITQCELVTVSRGLKTTGSSLESGLVFTSNHVAALDACLDIDWFNDFTITDNILYNAGGDVSSWPATLTGVRLGTNTNRGRIDGNQFIRVGTTTAYTSIDMQGGAWHSVEENTHAIGAGNTAVNIAGAAVSPDVKRQVVQSGNSAYIVNASTTATFEEFYNYSGSLGAIVTGTKRIAQKHAIGSGASDGPAGVALAGSICLTFSYDANTAVQHLFNGNNAIAYERRKTGGVWQSWGRVTHVYGSNANGEYHISPDGTLECWDKRVINSTAGAVASATWTFPFPASDTNSVVTTNVETGAANNVSSTASSITSTTAQINLYRSDLSVATSVGVSMKGRAF